MTCLELRLRTFSLQEYDTGAHHTLRKERYVV